MAAPVNTSPPTISAHRLVGQTVTGTNGSWNNSPQSYAYQWQRAEVVYEGGHPFLEDAEYVTDEWENIGGATSIAYVIAATEHRHILRLAVTATNGDGSATAYSVEGLIVISGGGAGAIAGAGALGHITDEDD